MDSTSLTTGFGLAVRSTIVPDRECWANFHCALRRRGLFVAFRLLVKIDRRFVVVVF
jgi:hypothetical protein